MLRAVRPPVRAAGASSQRSTAARPQLSRVARVAAGAAQQASVELELVALDGAVYTARAAAPRMHRRWPRRRTRRATCVTQTQVAAGGWLERAIKDAGSEANAAFASVWGCKSQGACGLCAFTVADGADLLGEPTPAEGKLRRLRPPQKSPVRLACQARTCELPGSGGGLPAPMTRRRRIDRERMSACTRACLSAELAAGAQARVVSDLDAAREPQLQADGGAPRRIRLEQLRVSEDSFS